MKFLEPFTFLFKPVSNMNFSVLCDKTPIDLNYVRNALMIMPHQ